MADGVGEAGLAGDFLRDGRGLPEIVILVASGFRMEKGEVAERGHVGRAYGRTGYCWRPASVCPVGVSRHAYEGFFSALAGLDCRNLTYEAEQIVHPSEAFAGHRNSVGSSCGHDPRPREPQPAGLVGTRASARPAVRVDRVVVLLGGLPAIDGCFRVWRLDELIGLIEGWPGLRLRRPGAQRGPARQYTSP